MSGIEKSYSVPDNWSYLKRHTNARIALGRTGVSIPMEESLSFRLAHANARDAVYEVLDKDRLTLAWESQGHGVVHLTSQVRFRSEYLQRPDLGRKLDAVSAGLLAKGISQKPDVALIVADGLSATAVNSHATPLLSELTGRFESSKLTYSPILLVEQGRVAISDEIGFLLSARLSVIIIGERPGLSAADSLGVYITYAPRPGNTDHARNCVSNIRQHGLGYAAAADKIFWLVREASARGYSGIGLKEGHSPNQLK